MVGAGCVRFFGKNNAAVTYNPGSAWNWSFSTVNSSWSSLPVMTGFKIGSFGNGIRPSIS